MLSSALAHDPRWLPQFGRSAWTVGRVAAHPQAVKTARRGAGNDCKCNGGGGKTCGCRGSGGSCGCGGKAKGCACGSVRGKSRPPGSSSSCAGPATHRGRVPDRGNNGSGPGIQSGGGGNRDPWRGIGTGSGISTPDRRQRGGGVPGPTWPSQDTYGGGGRARRREKSGGGCDLLVTLTGDGAGCEPERAPATVDELFDGPSAYTDFTCKKRGCQDVGWERKECVKYRQVVDIPDLGRKTVCTCACRKLAYHGPYNCQMNCAAHCAGKLDGLRCEMDCEEWKRHNCRQKDDPCWKRPCTRSECTQCCAVQAAACQLAAPWVCASLCALFGGGNPACFGLCWRWYSYSCLSASAACLAGCMANCQ